MMDATRQILRTMLAEAAAEKGDCYEVHANFLADLHVNNDTEELAKWTLVHGIPLGQGPIEGLRFGHCWMETDGERVKRKVNVPVKAFEPEEPRHTIPGTGITVVDLSNGREIRMPKEVYYAIGNIDPDECVYYTPQEAFERMVEEEIYGPWDTFPPR